VLLDPGRELADHAIQIDTPEKPFEEWNPPSLAEINKFICWAKEHIGTEIDSFTWDYRVGATMVVFEHYKQAIVALGKAEEYAQVSWGLFFNLATAHENEKNHSTALKYIRNFKSLSSLYYETDDMYKSAYWELLLAEGNCHRQCHDYSRAVQSFQDLLGQDIDEESDMTWLHLSALSGLFTTWTETKNYQSIIDFIRSWKNVTAQIPGPAYWLRKVAYVDGIHANIIVAAKNVGTVEEIVTLYQEAIDHKPGSPPAAGEQVIDTPAEVTEQLQYFQAVLRFHGSRSRHDQQSCIQYWENIVRRSDENPALYGTAWKASVRLAPTFLDNAVAEHVTALSSSSEDYVSRLEKLANLNTTIICNLREGSFDPRLCLARLYCLKEDHISASKQAQIRLCSVFDNWPESTGDTSLAIRFSNLSATLHVLDKDIDAVAAWQAIEPCQNMHASIVDADAPGTAELEQPSFEASHTNGVPAASENELEDDLDAPPSTKDSKKAYISNYSCDGQCGTAWKDVLADCWACKHCLCVQLCSGCHEKLLVGELHPLICNKDHKMLYLPPFDWEMWRDTPADMMIVGKQRVSRSEWVDRIRREFDVRQGQIDLIKIEKARELKAASVIAVRWRSRLQRIRARNPSTAPTLRRAKTVG
jgi:tetratricopeptide (TPR) repeat protein